MNKRQKKKQLKKTEQDNSIVIEDKKESKADNDVASESVASESAAGESATSESVAKKSVVKVNAMKETVTSGNAADDNVTDGSTTSDSLANENVVSENATDENVRKEDTVKKILSIMFFPLVLFIFEMVLEVSSGANMGNIHSLYVGLFSISYGLLIYFALSFLKNKKLRTILYSILLFALGFAYCMLYYLFCEFQLFYDLNTLFAGAGDAVTNFYGDIFAMMATFDGTWHFILYFLPFVFYIVWGRKYVSEIVSGIKHKLFAAIGAVVVYLACIGLVFVNPTDKDAYGKSYDYNTAIADFGLMTGMRLEVKRAIMHTENDVAFETVQYVDEAALSTEESVVSENDLVVSDNAIDEEIEEPIVLGDNELDIDFEALAQQDGGKYAALDQYVASLKASSKNEYTSLFEGKNLIFLTAEAFTAEAIDKRRTPTLYRMANKGIRFTDYYQPSSAGTTGGEYANIFGMLPTSGGSSMKKTATHYNWSTIGSRLSEKGYYGKAYHNNSYTYYDRHKTHINLGYSDGYEGRGNGMEAELTAQWPESDLEMMQATLPKYIDKQPFNIYYMTVSGHSLYALSKNAMAKKHWDEMEGVSASEPVKSYLAAQIELDLAMEYLIDELEKAGIADDTVIVISADHFPYGLDQNTGSLTYLTELYGRTIDNNLYRDHNRLIIWSGCLEDMDKITVDTPTSSMDILPTLCNLFNVDFDSRLLPGRDVFSDAEPLVFSLGYDWKTDKGMYISSRGKFYPSNADEEIPDGYVERIKSVVKDKITYSKGVLQQDYFRHVFGE